MEQLTHGWASQPDSRGTLDIVWSSLLTVFLCTWTVLCLNLPARTDSYFKFMLRKLRWMLLATIGPEFVLSFAIGQWASANRSVKDFDDPRWTMRHAFFADMGGFVLQPRESVPLPVNAKQLHWLVSHGYTSIPAIEQKDISDKSKADGFAKFITIFQVSWFILATLSRGIQHLAITTFELSAIAIVAGTLVTFLCWLNKPLDLVVPIIIDIVASISEILIQAGDQAKMPYTQTPLDFIDNQGPSWSTDVMSKVSIKTGPQQRPLERLGNDRIPHLTTPVTIVLFVLTFIYSGIHMVDWNFSFPSPEEKLLWRICSTILVVTTVLFWVVDRSDTWHRHGLWGFWLRQLTSSKGAIVEPPVRGEYRVSWIQMAVNGLLMVTYTLARIYLMVEVFVGLRALPETAFVNVEWINFIPHV
ncbi:uncharacterized protein RCO7_11055 [Rhynchosporium graminicola]|uniref:Uncharacterized protein n=1 Tax=Rhynchosporium graminicola TaxID=2792576 RepID=A0A1E1KVN1_9HELO|nr:uncharacterized protein RCO7_11055 [Rhynchosporium commune]